jgi:uncharacterized protein (DUF1501 family)
MPTRRAFLKSSGLGLLALGVGAGSGPRFLHRAAWAAQAPTGRRKTLVAIFQRGAMDGLAAVPPIDEQSLRELRPRLAMSAASSAARGGAAEQQLFDLGVGFGLHPAFEPLLPLWRDRRLAVVHAVGSPDPTRSHFDAQDYMEAGVPGDKGTRSGWLNRVAGELGHEATPLRAVSMTSALPKSLYGPAPALAVSRLEDFRLAGDLPGAKPGGSAAAQGGFEDLYRRTSQELLRETGAETFEAAEALAAIAREAGRGADRGYPPSPLGRALMEIALMIRADVGLEVAFAESPGWDTHVRQGTTNGSFAQRARDLASAIAAFWADLGERADDVVVLTMTEFGRTVRENGSAGTDHGHGSCLFVLGSAVDGCKVHGEFPGIAPDALYEGRDLAVTTDFRAVFSEVAVRHLGVDDGSTLFPGWRGATLPLFRG